MADENQDVKVARSKSINSNGGYLITINDIVNWYSGYTSEGSITNAPGVLDELRARYRKLCTANAQFCAYVGDLQFIATSMEHKRKRQMAAVKTKLKQSNPKRSISECEDIARSMNVVHDNNAAAALANYREAERLHKSIERCLAAMKGDIEALQEDMKQAGATASNWKPIFDQVEELKTENASLAKIVSYLYNKIKPDGKDGKEKTKE